jgi:hypothetical protein
LAEMLALRADGTHGEIAMFIAPEPLRLLFLLAHGW